MFSRNEQGSLLLAGVATTTGTRHLPRRRSRAGGFLCERDIERWRCPKRVMKGLKSRQFLMSVGGRPVDAKTSSPSLHVLSLSSPSPTVARNYLSHTGEPEDSALNREYVWPYTRFLALGRLHKVLRDGAANLKGLSGATVFSFPAVGKFVPREVFKSDMHIHQIIRPKKSSDTT
jgi:hypothetical protein